MKKRFKLFVLTLLMSLAAVPLVSQATASAATKINKKEITLDMGKTYNLKIGGTKKSVIWSSNDVKIAAVSSKGKVTAKTPGTATIKAKVNGKSFICKVTVQTVKGSIYLPYSAWDNTDITLQEYRSKEGQKISVQLLEYINGANANSEVMAENQFNDVPKDTQQWVLMKYHVKYISGSDELNLNDVFGYGIFYNESMNKSVTSAGTCSFAGKREGYDAFSITLNPSGEADVWVPMLINNTDGYLSFRLPVGEDKDYETIYSWFITKKQ